MSGMGAQTTELLSGGMILAGAGLSGFGLLRFLASRGRPQRDRGTAGEIVIGGGALQPGRTICVTAGPDAGGGAAPLAGSIIEITGSHCVVEVEIPPNYEQRFFRGDSLTVNVTDESAVYRFRARVQDASRTAAGQRLFLPRPALMTRLQRRRRPRVPLDLPATFSRVELNDSAGADPRVDPHRKYSGIVYGTVRDLSTGGLCAQLGGALRLAEIDSLLRLFRPESAIVVGLAGGGLRGEPLLGRVRSCGRAVTAGGLTAKIAVEFLAMTASEHEALTNVVAAAQRSQREATRMRQRAG